MLISTLFSSYLLLAFHDISVFIIVDLLSISNSAVCVCVCVCIEIEIDSEPELFLDKGSCTFSATI